jgi:hypothetical protein
MAGIVQLGGAAVLGRRDEFELLPWE